MVESLYTGSVSEIDLFKNTAENYGVPSHLRNTGFSFYLRYALLETMKELGLSENQLNQMAVISPRYIFHKIVNEGQRIKINTKLKHLPNGLISINQEMTDEYKKRICSLDSCVENCSSRSPFMRGLIYPAVFDIGRLDLQERTGLRFRDLSKNNIPLFMVVRSANYNYEGCLDKEQELGLVSFFTGFAQRDTPLLNMKQVLYSEGKEIATCDSSHVFIDARTQKATKSNQGYINERLDVKEKEGIVFPIKIISSSELERIIGFNQRKIKSIKLERTA